MQQIKKTIDRVAFEGASQMEPDVASKGAKPMSLALPGHIGQPPVVGDTVA